MSEFARVDSIELLKEFRAALFEFAEAVNVGLVEAETEIQRTAEWIKHEQSKYWKNQLYKRTELLTRAKITLKTKEQQKTPLGGRYSCVDEKKELAKAQRLLEEAEQKLNNVKRWETKLDEEAFNYKAVTQPLGQAVSSDIPRAVAQMDQIIDSLESYTSLTAPSMQPPPTETESKEEPKRRDELPSMARDGINDTESEEGGREDPESRSQKDGHT